MTRWVRSSSAICSSLSGSARLSASEGSWAGGYEQGFRRAMEEGADRIWAVDDDAEPRPDCLKHLLAEPAGAGVGVLVPLQIQPDGARAHPPSWNGPLFDAKVVRAIGYPCP